MMTEEGIVKLADMGLARETTDLELAKSEKGRAYGTPYYISPEQIRGEMDIDGRADIYGLGATLYHMLTGRVPFMADDPSDVMRKHLREELVPPDHINTSLSAGISEVVEVMMAKNKENRYSNCEELLEDLEAVRAGRAPYRARTKFDVSALQQLSSGEAVEEEEYYQDPAMLTRYKIMVIGLGAALAVSVLVIVLLLVR
jgi:serine/threonine-protein kinase